MQQTLEQVERYPGLARLDYWRRWLDGFVSILESYLVSLSSPLLTIGIGFSMMDFLTQGKLLEGATIGTAWAFIQTAAVDCQFISMWYKAKVAFKNRDWFALFGFVFLGLVLAFVTFGANAVPSLQHATGMDFSAALSSLGFDPNSLVFARSGVSIVLAIIAAWTRTVVVFDSHHQVVKSGDSQPTETQQKVVVKKEKKPRKPFRIPLPFFGKKTHGILPTEAASEEAGDQQKKEAQEPQKSGEDSLTQTDPNLTALQPKITQKLSPDVLNFPAKKTTRTSGNLTTNPLPKKNIFTKKEAARYARVSLKDIDEAIQKNTLVTAKNDPEKILKSSLEKFIATRKSGAKVSA